MTDQISACDLHQTFQDGSSPSVRYLAYQRTLVIKVHRFREQINEIFNLQLSTIFSSMELSIKNFKSFVLKFVLSRDPRYSRFRRSSRFYSRW